LPQTDRRVSAHPLLPPRGPHVIEAASSPVPIQWPAPEKAAMPLHWPWTRSGGITLPTSPARGADRGSWQRGARLRRGGLPAIAGPILGTATAEGRGGRGGGAPGGGIPAPGPVRGGGHTTGHRGERAPRAWPLGWSWCAAASLRIHELRLRVN
jgi:hypothetical protein